MDFVFDILEVKIIYWEGIYAAEQCQLVFS